MEIKTVYQAKQKFERIEQDWNDTLLFRDEEDQPESHPDGISLHQYDNYVTGEEGEEEEYEYDDVDRVSGKALKASAQLDLSTIKSILNDFSFLHSNAQVRREAS